VELVREVESSVLFLHPRIFFQFPTGCFRSGCYFVIGGLGGEDTGFTHYTKVLVFLFVCASLVEMRHFVSLFGKYLIKFVFFWYSVVEHRKRNLKLWSFFLLPWRYIVEEVIFFFNMYDVLLKAWLLNQIHCVIVG